MRRVSQTIILGDCLDVFRDLRDLDAIVADPPAGIGFMGRKWDKHSPHAAYQPPIPSRSKKHLREIQERHAFVLYWAERFAAAYDACHDDGVAIIWALPKTSDWTAEALRLAGWYVRDVITHLFGQGWPKTPSSLKPASEHWILCTKRPGLMGLNIDACRVDRGAKNTGGPNGAHPASIILSHHPDCLRAGERMVKSGTGQDRVRPASIAVTRGRYSRESIARTYGTSGHGRSRSSAGVNRLSTGDLVGSTCKKQRASRPEGHDDEGGASRFFKTFHYYAKASAGEKHAGCEHLYWRANLNSLFQFDRVTREEWEKAPEDERAQGNVHPTVKSIALMRWLHALTSAKRIGDLCAGSGSGAIAAYVDGIEWIGADVCPEAIEIAEARLAFWRGCTPDALARFCEAGEVPQRPKTDPRQVSMFGE